MSSIFPFERNILNVLNVCPAQLQPNVWRYIRGFESNCKKKGVIPTVELFFYFFNHQVRDKARGRLVGFRFSIAPTGSLSWLMSLRGLRTRMTNFSSSFLWHGFILGG